MAAPPTEQTTAAGSIVFLSLDRGRAILFGLIVGLVAGATLLPTVTTRPRDSSSLLTVNTGRATSLGCNGALHCTCSMP